MQLETNSRLADGSLAIKQIEYFDSLFDDLEGLWFYESDEVFDSSDVGKQPKLRRMGAIRTRPRGSALFRGRRADTSDNYTQILLTPHAELAPPPSRHARAGRMNPEGVPVFYGALEVPTCLAEMRSSIGSHIVVGRFETTRDLQLLDFGNLDKALWGGAQLSYFQPDFETQVARRQFRRRVHKLISQPIVPGHESDYLITQVLAEYLSHVRKPDFDGILFRSTQRVGGTNVVLFPKGAGADDAAHRFSVEFVKDSEELYRTSGIKYDMSKLEFSLLNNSVHVHRDDDHDDDD